MSLPQAVQTRAKDPTFAEMLSRLWDERFTGTIVLHVQSGQPTVIEKLHPERIRLDTRAHLGA